MAAQEKSEMKLAEVFENPSAHLAIARIIRDHSTNRQDVRSAALEGLSFRSGENILDVGCGFGFFTLALKGRVRKGTKVLGIDRFAAYRKPFLDSCKSAGLDGRFTGSGIKTVYSLPSASFDLVLCSYCLYFFPGIIPELSRILKPDGIFVTITHAESHMKELIAFIKETYKMLKLHVSSLLPCEKLTNNFNDKNGGSLLSPSFARVKQKEYLSSLVFKPDNFKDLKTYLMVKRPFFIPDHLKDKDLIFDKIMSRLHQKLIPEFRITKDDSIFICQKT